MPQIQSACVFCASSTPKNPLFSTAAKDLGKLLAESSISLIYGGGKLGLMNNVAESCINNGGSVTGVLPTPFTTVTAQSHGTTIYVSSMHTRKQKMNELSDAFVCLPGGYGTFEEVLEMITWSQLNIHRKPIVVLNVDGFFDCLKGQIERANLEGFIKDSSLGLVKWVDSPASVVEVLREFEVEKGARFDLDWTEKDIEKVV